MKRFYSCLRFVWGRLRFFVRSQIDCFQLTFTSRRAVKAEVAEQFAAIRAVTKAIRDSKPSWPESAQITVVDKAGGFTMPRSDLNSLAVMLYTRGGFPRLDQDAKLDDLPN